MINLLPKENKNGTGSNRHFNLQIMLAITAVACVVFSLGFYWGYLYHQVSIQEAKLEELQLEMKCYSTPYQKIRNMESILEQLRNKENLKRTVFAGYLPPLSALNTLIQFKTASIWFERVQFSGMNGSFIVTGGATNYKTWAAFIGELEQNKDAFQELKPEQATIHDSSAGREYVQFKISGVLSKRGEQNVQEH
jgi:Tfp pilus assembly protein PilN